MSRSCQEGTQLLAALPSLLQLQCNNYKSERICPSPFPASQMKAANDGKATFWEKVLAACFPLGRYCQHLSAIGICLT